MKYLLIVLTLMCSINTFSQSKKKQIEMLQWQVDSLNLEQEKSGEQVEELRDENLTLRKIMLGYVRLIDELNGVNLALENQFKDSLKAGISEVRTSEEKSTSSNQDVSRDTFTVDIGDINQNNSSFSDSEIGYGASRVRLTNLMDIQNVEIKEDAMIYYKLTVDALGNVRAFTIYQSRTTTTDWTLINRIGYAIMEQVKYNEEPGSPLIHQSYAVHVKAD